MKIQTCSNNTRNQTNSDKTQQTYSTEKTTVIHYDKIKINQTKNIHVLKKNSHKSQ